MGCGSVLVTVASLLVAWWLLQPGGLLHDWATNRIRRPGTRWAVFAS